MYFVNLGVKGLKSQEMLQSWSKVYMVHLENLLCFQHCPLFDDGSGSFSKRGPPPSPLPPYNVASRGTLWVHWPSIVWGVRGRNDEIVKKGQVYHDFWPGLQVSVSVNSGPNSLGQADFKGHLPDGKCGKKFSWLLWSLAELWASSK